MDEESTNTSYVETYVTKQENLLLEFVRRTIQAETKVAVFESALQKMHKKNEELVEQAKVAADTLSQSINGLAATTAERDNLSARLSKQEELKAGLESQVIQYRTRLDLLEEENRLLKRNLETKTSDFDVIQANYKKVLQELEKTTSQTSNTVKRPKPKKQEPNSEWIDGEQ